MCGCLWERGHLNNDNMMKLGRDQRREHDSRSSEKVQLSEKFQNDDDIIE